MTASTPADAPDHAHRLTRLRALFAESGLDALLVTHPPNLRYLLGFDGSMGALLLGQAGAVLIVDGRYLTVASERASALAPAGEVRVALVTRTFEQTIAQVVMREPSIVNLGVEAAAMTLSRFDRLTEALGRAEQEGGPEARGPRLRGAERLVERIRVIKDAGEIATLREAADMLSRVARSVLDLIQPGRTERDVAADIDTAIRRAGFERPAFETIVASGPNGALPHARPGARRLEPGDGVVLDFGGVHNGYCVDLTRTVQLPPFSDALADIVAGVTAAHAAALAAVRPGVRASDVDAAAREALGRHGLGDAFVHGTGHGLGLEVHEEPRIGKAGAGLDETLAAGMVFTIEPGAYVPGLGGVRIEDDVLVVEQGCEVLTDVPIDGTGAANARARQSKAAGSRRRTAGE